MSATPEYKVVTVTELDRMVFSELEAVGAAKPNQDDPGTYIVTDKEKARTQTIMPVVFNRLGKEGWQLAGVNKMECFIFQKEVAVEYLVHTAGDLDRMSLAALDKDGHLAVEKQEDAEPIVQIKDTQAAKIQVLLPAVLSEIGDDGWELAAVSGPQLYIFTRPI